MTDDLEGLDAKLLRGMLPALYKKAQDGDQRAIDTVLRILQRLEKNAPAHAPNDLAEPGFTAPINVPGQIQSRASRKEFEALLESPPTDDPFVGEGILQLSDAYFRQMEDGENDDKWDWRKHAYVAWACIPKNMRYPKTINGFAALVGLTSSSTIRKWRSKDPEIPERIASLPRLMLNQHVSDVLHALTTVAADPVPQSHQDRKLFLEIAGVYDPKNNINLRGVVGTVELDDPLDDAEQAAVERVLKEVAALE